MGERYLTIIADKRYGRVGKTAETSLVIARERHRLQQIMRMACCLLQYWWCKSWMDIVDLKISVSVVGAFNVCSEEDPEELRYWKASLLLGHRSEQNGALKVSRKRGNKQTNKLGRVDECRSAEHEYICTSVAWGEIEAKKEQRSQKRSARAKVMSSNHSSICPPHIHPLFPLPSHLSTNPTLIKGPIPIPFSPTTVLYLSSRLRR